MNYITVDEMSVDEMSVDEMKCCPGACTIKTLRILNLRIPLQVSVFVQTSAFVTDSRKDTSLL
jgi:hypothetical protein